MHSRIWSRNAENFQSFFVHFFTVGFVLQFSDLAILTDFSDIVPALFVHCCKKVNWSFWAIFSRIFSDWAEAKRSLCRETRGTKLNGVCCNTECVLNTEYTPIDRRSLFQVTFVADPIQCWPSPATQTQQPNQQQQQQQRDCP
jgi:hypothetical protein